MRHRDFRFRPHVDAGGDAMIEHRLAEVPAVRGLRFPEAGQNELAGRIDDAGVGGNVDLPLASDGDNLGALNHDDGIGNGRSAVPVDEGSALDCQRALLRRLRGDDRDGERNPEQRTGDEYLHAWPPGLASGSALSPEPTRAELTLNPLEI